ncbi:serine/threonine protein kinase [Aquisalimonas asiatica]|uniref:Stress response kinase A n=1 Tax=Aquisalimonas asiatica TaxID=406100 RepID=A0A1H8Q9F1_9GAMM|nr:serine/threonine protein kinase [Aquisalimonas asiatica]SEO50850.1 Ser/Thr protein kinase RdoA involved in Cpx stress response, MazF antagonist [Aquisalimonas asiatica]
MQQTISETPYADLGPEIVLDAVDSLGLEADGRLLALNSYENRVYQIGREDGPPLVGKFYREGRWSDAAILEEHAFTIELSEREIPVVAPLAFNGTTLHYYEGFRFALFPRQGGRLPDLDNQQAREWIGRFMGRLHMVGGMHAFQARPTLTSTRMGHDPVAYITGHGLIPPSLESAYATLAADVLQRVDAAFERAGDYAHIRLHGDCHPGNILWTDDGPHFVDLDDAMNGPAIQDLWMLISGDRVEMTRQLDEILEGYEDFASLDPRQLHLVEALRTLRMIHFSFWLAKRWNDPAFPPAFPWFASERYWEEQILALREQAALLDEPPLQL